MNQLSQRSIDRMTGCHPDLVAVVTRAIELSPIDFFVVEGLRTKEQQKKNVASGASQTMNSRHLTGKAVDVGALVDGKYEGNDLKLYGTIAKAFQEASEELLIPIRWGGCWKELSSIEEPYSALLDYGDERRSQGLRPFFDAGHFELPTRAYG